MLNLIGAIILIVATLMLLLLRHVYNELPAAELKRQARAKDPQARKLYKVAVYHREFEALVFIITSITIAGSIILLTKSLGVLLTFVVSFVVTWIVFIWPKVSNFTLEGVVASWAAPFIARIISAFHPLLRAFADKLDRPTRIKDRLYQTEDLLRLIEAQGNQPDNRIPKDQLKMLSGVLTYADRLVRDVMIPKRAIVSAKATDTLGPIVMEELYRSGHSRFPVTGNKADEIVGILYLRDVIDAQRGGKVKEVMKKDVFYVHEEHSLQKVLHAFLKTKHHLFVVVDDFEEVIGIITIEDVLEQIIGKQIMDEFDKYEDLRAVAHEQAAQEHAKKTTEVVE